MSVQFAALLKRFGDIIGLVEQGLLTAQIVEHSLDKLMQNPAGSSDFFISRNNFHFVVAVYCGLDYQGEINGPLISQGRERARDLLDHSELNIHETFRLRVFFGIDDPLGRPATIREVAMHFGIAEDTARRSIRNALEKIRHAHNIPTPQK